MNPREKQIIELAACVVRYFNNNNNQLAYIALASLTELLTDAGYDVQKKPLVQKSVLEEPWCHAGRDGDCAWANCPQQVNCQDHCPLDVCPECHQFHTPGCSYCDVR